MVKYEYVYGKHENFAADKNTKFTTIIVLLRVGDLVYAGMHPFACAIAPVPFQRWVDTVLIFAEPVHDGAGLSRV